MPLPTPNDNESQADFMSRCMPVVADDPAYESQEQRVAVCMNQFRRSSKAVKVLDEAKGLLGGWGIPFGGPVKDENHADGKDLDGEYFDNTTDFCLDWFPNDNRPALYDHGTDPEIKLVSIGKQVSKAVDPKLGVWVETQLDMANQYAKYILDLAKKGVLAYSSGALGGYVKRERDGKLSRWPWIEQTLTVRPANPYALIPSEAIKHFEGIEVPSVLTDAASGEQSLRDNIMADVNKALTAGLSLYGKTQKAADQHGNFDGEHSHAHPANSAQGDDTTHTHQHTHSGDDTHTHSHAKKALEEIAAHLEELGWTRPTKEQPGKNKDDLPDMLTEAQRQQKADLERLLDGVKLGGER